MSIVGRLYDVQVQKQSYTHMFTTLFLFMFAAYKS